MEKPTLYDWLYMYAEEGYTEKTHHVYLSQALKLYYDGFTVQLTGAVPGHPGQYNAWISWEHAEPGTVAYKFLEVAKAA